MIRVMIVAQHTEVREGLCTLLNLAQDVSLTAVVQDAHSAADQAAVDPPAVALIDLEMPSGEGYETIRRLQRYAPHIKAIAITAHEYPEVREEALRAGAALVIVKGTGLSDMVSAIRLAAGDSKATGEPQQ